MSIAEATDLVKFHLSLNVAELTRSVEFYMKLFGQAPAKLRCDYAKFELTEPPVVLSLIPSSLQPEGRLNHIGIRLLDSAALVDLQARLENSGCATTREDGVECCYSKQTKFWVPDPDGTLWEFYILHAESDEDDHHHDHKPGVSAGSGKAQVCPKPEMKVTSISLPISQSNSTVAAEPVHVVRQHLLTQPLPAKLDDRDGSVDQWQLHGTLNMKTEPSAIATFMSELARTLKPGGNASIHMVTADRPLDRPPQLPGPASLVQHVPTEMEAVAAFEAAGLVDVQITKLNDKSCFLVGPAEVRETKIEARQRDAVAGEVGNPIPVLYRGPLREASDDFGFTYRRGVRTAASPEAVAALRAGGLAEYFTIFDNDALPNGRCGS